MDTPLPKLRAIEAFPVDVEARKVVCLRDPLRYAAEPLFVPYPAYFLTTLLDGRHSLTDLQRAFQRQYGTLLTGDELGGLLSALDEHHFLESGRFASHRAAVDAAFHAAPLRAPAHAGTSYPAERATLRAHLDGFFVDVPPPPSGRRLAGLVAPHIDLRVGGRAYGHAYAALAAAAPAARYVVLGTSHAAGRHFFAATRKDFATPLGTVATDGAFVTRLAGRTPDLFRDELLHRIEHAVEFQVVMLQHVLGSRRPFSVVPILVTSFHELIAAGTSPGRDPRVAGFVAALRATLAEDDVPTVIIAGVDFAHVGAKFGDRDLSPALVAETEAKDHRLIGALERGDPDGFAAELAVDADRTRICGAAPLATFLEVLRGVRGRLLHYDQSRDDATHSAVTYASLAFDAD